MLIEYNKVNIYQADEMILEGVDFQVDADQFVYIIGKVGSGKSTLLKPYIARWISTRTMPRLPMCSVET